MSRLIALAGATSLVLLLPAVALGAEPDQVKLADTFPWQPDFAQGAVIATIGAIGALIVMFTLVGGTIPGTAGKAQLDQDKALLDRLIALQEAALRDKRPGNDAELNNAIRDLRQAYLSERNRQWLIGGAIYILLGAFFAAFLAGNYLQAIVIGAGWTGLVGSVGLKVDFQARKAEKDDAIANLAGELGSPPPPPAGGRSASPRAKTKARPQKRVLERSQSATEMVIEDAMIARAL